MYITNLEDIVPALESRRTRKKEIQTAVDAWIRKNYGIQNFTALSQSFLGINDEETCLVLCRQIPSVRTEDIACRIISRILGYELLSLSFLDDSFSCDNHEKKSYLHLKWADYGKKKNVFLRGERIVDGSLIKYVGHPLSNIPTSAHIPGRSLADFHFNLRTQLFGSSDRLVDVSELHREYLRQSDRRPTEVYRSNGNSVWSKTGIDHCDVSAQDFRPPSHWYYPIFFSWFLDGSLIMLETYDNELAQVSRAKALFERTMQTIESIVGFKPLVLKVPPLDDKMLCLPKKIIEEPQAIDAIAQEFQNEATGDSVELLSRVADRIVGYRP